MSEERRTIFSKRIDPPTGKGGNSVGIPYKTVCACRSSIMDIPPVPDQPQTFKFPQRSFGQKKTQSPRSFQSSWFANRTWLHNDEANDLAYCHGCLQRRKVEQFES